MPCRGSLPAHCYKILQRKRNGHTLTEWCKINGKLTLAGMKQGAIYSGMKAEICLQNIHQLTQRKLPIILFTLNDFNVPGYVVCYGIHESRFIIWEPEFGLMQYWADEMKTLWIKGIALTLFPTQDFMNSANLHLNGGKYIAGANYGKER